MILHYFSKEPVDIIVHIGKQKQIHFKTLRSPHKREIINVTSRIVVSDSTGLE